MVDVSVLTPSYNYGHFIEDAILSVTRQSDVSVEHVIQDASSSDGTLDVLERYEEVVDWRSESDRGQSDALNRALRRASGRWIGWLNADEFYLPGALSSLVRIGEKSNADVVYGDCVIIDAKGSLVRLLPQHRFSALVLREYGCYIPSNSTIFRRSALGEDPWDEDIKRIMDWDLFMKLLQEGAGFAHVARPVGAFRVHAEQVTAASYDQFYGEDAAVTSRYGQPSDNVERWKASRRGRWTHPMLKLVGGAYIRQFRARAFRGKDMRWFRGEVEGSDVASLLTRSSNRG